MRTLEITEDNFIDWYFDSGSDDEQKEIRDGLAEDIINQLRINSRATISLDDLLDNVSYEMIPMSIIKGYEHWAGEIGDHEEFDNEEIEINLI